MSTENYYKNHVWYYVRKMKGYNAIFSCEYDFDLYKKMRSNQFDILHNMNGEIIVFEKLKLENDQIVSVEGNSKISIKEDDITAIRFYPTMEEVVKNITQQSFEERKKTIEKWERLCGPFFLGSISRYFNDLKDYCLDAAEAETNYDIKMQYKKLVEAVNHFIAVEDRDGAHIFNYLLKTQAIYEMCKDINSDFLKCLGNAQTKNESEE